METGIEIYKAKDSQIKVEVTFNEETVWLTQEQMAKLFGKGRTTVTEHIQNIFKEGELDEKLVCRNSRHTTQHGEKKSVTPPTVLFWNCLQLTARKRMKMNVYCN